MKKRFFLLSLLLTLCLLPLTVSAADGETEFPLDGLPIISLTSDSGIQEVNLGRGYVPGNLTLYSAEGERVLSVDFTDLHRRGLTSDSSQPDKKPYTLRLVHKAELVEGAGKCKKWCLLSGDMYGEHCAWIADNPTLAQLFAFQLYEDLGGAAAIELQPVSLYYNGDYRGVYLLCQHIGVSRSRVNVRESIYSVPGTRLAEEYLMVNGKAVYVNYYSDAVLMDGGGGFLIELHESARESCFVRTSRGHNYNLRSPDYPTRDQMLSLGRFLEEFEDALYNDSGVSSEGKYLGEYADLDYLVAKLAVDQVTCQCDMFRKSCYYYLDTDEFGAITGKLIAGPAWDYDGSGLRATWFRASENYVRQFTKHGEIMERLNRLSEGALKEKWAAYLGEGGQVERWIEELTPAMERNKARWSASIDFLGSSSDLRSAAAFLEKLQARFDCWYSYVWTEPKLLGVTAEWDSESGSIVPAVSCAGEYLTELREVLPDGSLSKEAVASPLSGRRYVVMVTTADPDNRLVGTKYEEYGSLTYGRYMATMMFSNPVTVP